MGESVWGAQQRFRLRIGPLDGAQFNHFLPGGEALEQLVAAVKTLCRRGEGVGRAAGAETRRDPRHPARSTGRMGLTTWIGRPQRCTDDDEVVLRPTA